MDTWKVTVGLKKITSVLEGFVRPHHNQQQPKPPKFIDSFNRFQNIRILLMRSLMKTYRMIRARPIRTSNRKIWVASMLPSRYMTVLLISEHEPYRNNQKTHKAEDST
jgi:hypothetical protein